MRNSANKINSNNTKGFSLVEILVAIATFVLLAGSTSFLAIEALRYAKTSDKRITASVFLQDTSNSILENKVDLWSSIILNADGQPKHIDFISNKLQIANGIDQRAGISSSFTLTAVNRDSSGNIVQEGGTPDPHTKRVTITESWVDSLGFVKTLEQKYYINDWNVPSWLQTTQADFVGGSFTDAHSTNNFGGEIQLDEMFYSNWCKPELSITTYDIPRQGYPSNLSAILGHAFLGTGANASGIAFQNISINSTNYPPTVSVAGELDGYKVNDVFADADYAYLATDTNDREAVIVDMRTLPYHEEGRFDATGTSNATAIYVSGTKGYLGVGGRLRVFDLSSKVGLRSELGSKLFNSGTTISDIQVVGNYAYLSLTGSGAVNELSILDISNPANITQVGWADFGVENATRLFVNADGTRTYVVSGASVTYDEAYILDTSTKTGARPTISSFDTSGMSALGITVIDNRAIVVGQGGQEYQVWDVSSESNPTKCGGLNIDAGINGVESVMAPDDTAYSYIITQDTLKEFQIIRGGQGGGGSGGHGFVSAGTYLSSIFDTNSTETTYYTIDWAGTIASGTNIRIQIRTCTLANCSDGTWMGPDGTASTYFTNQNGTTIHSSANNHRYIQYKVDLGSDTVLTPIFEQIRIDYQQ